MTTAWKQLGSEEARDRWDRMILTFPEQTVFQTYGWGSYKRELGWEPMYWLAEGVQGEPLAMAQSLAYRYPLGTAVVWCRGGPVGDPRLWNQDLRQSIAQALRCKRLYMRISSDRAISKEDAAAMAANGWRKPLSPLSTDRSLWIDPSPGEPDLLAGLSANWRHNLNRGRKKSSARLWANPSGAELSRVYESMQAYKGLTQQHSREDLDALFKRLNDKISLFRCDDEQGRLIAFRACAIHGASAWDLLAASAPEGRKAYASYSLLWAVLEDCRRKGVKRYDLGGVDPDGVKGVYDFKRGTGAKDIEFLGEWDWAGSQALRWLANWAIKRKQP